MFINEKNLIHGKFEWHEGYGGFSYGHSQIRMVYEYIKTQEIHHQTRSFREEYLEFPDRYEIKYEDRFLFEFFE